MTVLNVPADEMLSTNGKEFQYVDTIGKTWQQHPDWKDGDPWEDRFVYPEDEGLQTLGWQILTWAHTFVNSPDGTGKIRLTPEQQRFILWWYAFYPDTGLPRYREACLVRSKGWGKDPVAALLCIVEFVGPCRLGGWSADGEPIGVAHWNPVVQLSAVSKDQNRNTSGLFPVMMDSAFQDMFEVNLGIEVSYAQSRKCTLDVLSSNFRSKEGARASFVVENEIHHWVYSKGGLDFHEVLGRNLVKRGHVDPFARRVMITNAYKPSEESVARMVRESWEDAQAGRSIDTDTILYDSIEARSDVPLIPPAEFWEDEADPDKKGPTLEERISWLAGILLEMRGDSYWLAPTQTAEEILSPQNQGSISQSRRFYLNQVTAAEEAWLDRADIRAAIDKDVAEQRRNADVGMDNYEIGWAKVAPDEPVVLFFDGSKSDDATGVVGCRVSDGYCFTVGVWQRPSNIVDEEKETWSVDRSKVDAQLRRAMSRFRVVAFWADPSHAKDDADYTPYWDALLDTWHRDFSDELAPWANKGATGGKHAIMWDMVSPARTKEFVAAAQKTVQDFQSLDIKIDGHPALVQHLTNAQEREDERNGITLGKESRYSPRKIDLAVCLVGARMLARIVKLGGYDESSSGEFWGS